MSEIEDFERSLNGYNNLQERLVEVLNKLASAVYFGNQLTNNINGSISVNENDIRVATKNRELVNFIDSIINYMKTAVIPYTYDSAVNAARSIDQIREQEASE